MVRHGVVNRRGNWLMLELTPLERVCLVAELPSVCACLRREPLVCVNDVVGVLVRVVVLVVIPLYHLADPAL